MIKKVKLLLRYENQEEYDQTMKLIKEEALSIKPHKERRYIDVVFIEGSPVIDEIRKIPFLLQSSLPKIEYTEKELEEIPYFELSVYPPATANGITAKQAMAKYIYEKCSHCRLGAVQITPLRLPTKLLGFYDICCIDPEIVISSRLKTIFEREGVTGIEYMKVINGKTQQEDEGFFEIKAVTELPPMSDHKNCRLSHQCSVCGEPECISFGPSSYKLNDFKDEKDFYFAHESYNIVDITRNRGERYHKIVISKKVKHILEEIGADTVRTFPIFFKELYE